MVCPFCGNEEQSVLNKRPTFKGTANWRRRKCTQCNGSFTTYETIDLLYIKVIKRNGEARVFNRAKLFTGINIAFRQLKNMDGGDAALLAEEVTRGIEQKLIKEQVKRISTTELVEWIAKELKEKSFPAMLNYISYYVKPKSYATLMKFIE